MFYNEMLCAKHKLEKQIVAIRRKLQAFPEGKLVCTKNQKGYKWYQSDGHKLEYISKKNRILAEKLAHKRYLTLQLENKEQEKRAIDSYLECYDEKSEQEIKEFLTSPRYQELITPIFKPLSKDLEMWAKEEYVTNLKKPEHLIYKAPSGKMVRSKSEMIIDMILFQNNIPFRYECALLLGKTQIFPDFTIRHPKTGKLFYWEHFGMMDDSSYAKKAGSKIQLYISQGIIPTIQLITTYETKEHPLTIETIQKIVEQYFLD